jgi:membrane associated rhomboid family serine protease
MVQASVGFQCPECVKGAAKASPVVRLRELRPGRPVVTEILIALNALAFLATAIDGRSFMESTGALSDRYLLVGFNFVVEPTSFGFTRTPIGVAEGEWYRIFTGGFLHAGLLHLGMNMLLLYLLGTQLEPLLGRMRFLALYVACLVAGSFGVLLTAPTTATVGASGAIFGLMGAAVVAQRMAPNRVALGNIGALIVVNLIFTFAVPGIAIGAHVGGLVAGVLVGALVLWLERLVRAPWLGTVVCVALTAVLVVGCIWAADHWADPILSF